MKKDELIKMVGQLEEENSVLQSKIIGGRDNAKKKDDSRRKEFTKVLGKYESSTFNPFNDEDRVRPLSWEAIFFAIGELKAGKNYDDVLEELEKVRENLLEINNKNRNGEQGHHH